MILRRYLYRLLWLRSLVTITAVIILLYLIKTLSEVNSSPDMAAIKNELRSDSDASIHYFVPENFLKKDWHNYQQIEEERKRVGTGEQGQPAHLAESDSELEQALYAVNGFNGALSDRIALNRSLPDIRHAGCRARRHLAALPAVSVVVPFHNEHWSTLLRTAVSVLNRSPPELIKEVFLVDDASTKEFLKRQLDEYVAKHLAKVSVVRLARRSGLIAARLAGARLATADVLVFLDSHTEANVNWLPPLLEPIAMDHRTVVCPLIDVVAYDTFEYRAQDEGARGAFDWELYYKRLPLLPRDERNMPEPFESPVMAGGLFAISRAFFWQLGGYDPGLDIWGGEQYELSFKVWQCGGRMLDAPCSRVGHIYRKFAPFPNPGHGDFVGRNYRRVAEVWMDEFAEHVYARRPHYRDLDPGELGPQRALRRRLHCKPFRWFITQVAFDLVHKYPPVEPSPFAEGRIRPLSHKQLCVDAHHGAQNERLQLKPCSNSASAEQQFVFTWHKDIKVKNRKMCWDLPESAARSPVLLYTCHLGGGNQLWRYHPDTKEITPGSGTGNCLEWEAETRALYVNRCSGAPAQRWAVDTTHAAQLAKWDSMRARVTGPVEDY